MLLKSYKNAFLASSRLCERNIDVYGWTRITASCTRISPEVIQAGGNEFVQRLLTPVSIDTLLLLSDAGWSISRVFRFRSLLGIMFYLPHFVRLPERD
ncbi:MAG: hypothetical protein IIB73_08560 [Proteobacteria bacterium]|nr:hypothetical protein [Pseudomonadota bacterium]